MEYQDDIIKVVVQASDLTSEQAAEIMSIIFEYSVADLYPEIEYI